MQLKKFPYRLENSPTLSPLKPIPKFANILQWRRFVLKQLANIFVLNLFALLSGYRFGQLLINVFEELTPI
jgi:hypothetical protein